MRGLANRHLAGKEPLLQAHFEDVVPGTEG
jgi:hypothetical protein